MNNSSFLRLPNGTSWPNPQDPNKVEDALRHGTPTRGQLLTAAAYMSAYRHLVWQNRDKRQKAIAAMRETVTTAPAEHEEGA